MYQKFLSVLLCLCLLCGMSTAMAESTDITDVTDLNFATEYENARQIDEAPGSVDGNNVYTGTMKINVLAEDVPNDYEPPEYYVEIVWGAMYFGYGALGEGQKLWNTEEHKYEYRGIGDNDIETGWFLINEEKLDDSYNKGENGVAWVHGNGIDTTQAHVLIFNHSNRAVVVDATVEEVDKYAQDMSPVLTAETKETVSTVKGTMSSDKQQYQAELPRGVPRTEDKDTRWLPETTIGLVVNMEGDGSNLPDTKELIAHLNITLSEVESEEEGIQTYSITTEDESQGNAESTEEVVVEDEDVEPGINDEPVGA